MRYLLILLAILGLGLPLQGQTKTQARIILDQASAKLFPHDWTIVPVSEAFFLMKHPSTQTAYTDLGSKVTFVREHYILTATPDRLRHTLLHEAGHIQCQCAFEDRAEAWANSH